MVLQCLYVQCQTSQFASAAHHALFQCTGQEFDDMEKPPSLIRRNGNRKRAVPANALQSNFPMASVRFSAPPRVHVSGAAIARPARTTASQAMATNPTSAFTGDPIMSTMSAQSFVRPFNGSITATPIASNENSPDAAIITARLPSFI